MRGPGRPLVIATAAALVAACAGPASPPTAGGDLPEPAIAPSGRHYACREVSAPPRIDGRLDDEAWQAAPWTESFVDIRGGDSPAPALATRARLVWDAEHLYVAAELTEPHVWATLTERDSVIFHDDDFELFLDPDADTHDYIEIEVNALGTVWDLLLTRPYRDDGLALTGWDIPGLRVATAVDGTLNDPSDRDRGWTVEMAVPWRGLCASAGVDCPPGAGDRWRLNMTRVDWPMRIGDDGRYAKVREPVDWRDHPESNWVWAPQGLINIHYPEMWGTLELVDAATTPTPAPGDDERARWALRQVYHRQRAVHARDGRYTASFAGLGRIEAPPAGWSWPPEIVASERLFEATIVGPDGRELAIRADGWVGWLKEE